MSLSLFETKPPLALLARFAWPSILSLFANALYNVVDRAFVGQLVGTEALTAVSVVFPLSIAILAAGLGLGSGVAAQVSLSLGAQDKAAAEETLGQGLGLALIVSAILGALLIPLTEPLLVIMATPAAVVPQARDFFLLTLAGMPFLTISIGVGMAIRSQGRAKTALLTGLVGIVLNIAFCVLFVGVWHWGLMGSAWATVWAQILGCLVTVGFYFTPLSHLRLKAKDLVPRKAPTSKIVALGAPTFLGQMIGMALMIILNVRVQEYGAEKALAVVGVINTLSSLFFMPAIGMIQGAVPLFGYYQGAGKAHLNRKVFFWVLGITTAFFGVCTLAVELWPEAMLGIFSRDPELIAFGIPPLRVFLALTFLAALQILPGAYFQAIGRSTPALILNLVRPIALAILVLVLPTFWGFNGFLASGPLSDALGIALALGLLIGEPSLRRQNLQSPETSVDSLSDLRP